jgi:hypothetical protein
MAAVALNSFKTIRKQVTTSNVGIYTCPVGVAAIVLLAQVTNVSTGSSSFQITASHSRGTESPTDFQFANAAYVAPNDSLNLVPDGRLALETNDVIKIQADADGVLNIVLSILETAKQ